MQTEKIAIIVLVIIVVGALSTFLVLSNEDIFENLFGGNSGTAETGSIELGDCADVNYIVRYASNNTIFEASYNDTINKIGGSPLKVFVSSNSSEISFKDDYSSVIEGFAEGLVGLKEGETKTIGPIPPEKAYGAKKLEVGDTFYTRSLAIEMNQTVEVTRLTDDFMDLKWINFDEIGKFTMPQMVLLNLSSMNQNEIVLYCPPYYIWENSTEIINSTEDIVTVRTTPTKTDNLSDNIEPLQFGNNLSFIFHDATTATWDEDSITITNSPVVGSNYTYTVEYYGQSMNYIFGIEGITNDSINVSIMLEGTDEKTYQEASRVIEFSRNYELPAKYEYIPTVYIEMIFATDFEREGISTHELAGEPLTYEVEIVKVYKASQEES